MKKILTFLIATFACIQAITFNCTFTSNQFWSPYNKVYACHQPILQSIADTEDLTEVFGTQEDEKTNIDVKILNIQNDPKLTYFPRQIGNFFLNVYAIMIENTNITELNGDALSSCQNLTMFTMRYNSKLETISGNFFSQMEILESIDLHGNAIKQVEVGVFSGSNTLKTIGLGSNNLEFLENGVFSGCSGLVSIGLDGNNFKIINEGVFAGLPALEMINLQINEFERLAGHPFTGAPILKQLYFYSNNLKHVSEDFIEVLQNLTYVQFQECNCVNQDAWDEDTKSALITHLRANCSDIQTTTTEILTESTTTPEPSCSETNKVVCDLQQQNQFLIEKNAQLDVKVDELKTDVRALVENNEELRLNVEFLKFLNDEINLKMNQVLEGLLNLSTRACGV